MEVKPGYKQTEVGAIPSDWETKALGQIGEALIGLTYKPADVRDHGTLVLRSSNIQNDALAFDDNVFVDADIPERIRVRSGDVLVCVRNGSRELIGKSTLLDERTRGMTFGAFMAVYRSPIGKLASYLFQSEILKRQIHEHLGATINQITNKSLSSFRIPFPPSEIERFVIAEALSDVDGLLAGLDGLVAKKRDLKQAAMQQLLTGQTRLPGFHGEWDVRALNEVCTKIQDGTHFSPKLGGRDYLYVTSKNVGFGNLDLSTADLISTAEHEKIYKRCDVKQGDLLLTKDGANTGNCALNSLHEPFSLLSSVAFLRFDKRRHVPAFFLYQVLSTAGQQQISDLMSGNAITRLTLAKIKSLRFACPSFEEQTAIAEVLTDMDAELAALEQRRKKTRALKQAMMQELLTGKTRLI